MYMISLYLYTYSIRSRSKYKSLMGAHVSTVHCIVLYSIVLSCNEDVVLLVIYI